ncbi:glycosyltransferase [Empedobacter brevis]|uniref:glycosyltransferase n=1 Tax=Empedobacter brevis TaxID=247 RepID=UPI0028D69E2A|nr:glycosyltransferase [Empedobacter brevis]
MKIVQIITSLNLGGAEKLLVESIPFYQERNLNPDIITLKKHNTILTDELKKEHKGTYLGITEGTVYNPILIFKLINLLKTYDVVHAHLFPTLYWVVLAKFIGGLQFKIIYTEHSTNNKRRKYKLFQLIDRFIYSRVDKIVTIANEVDVELKKHLGFKNQTNFELINNGVNLKKFQQATSYEKKDFFDNKSKILIQVSSFRYPKDQKTVIRSLASLNENIKLLLVGDGPLIEENKRLVEELNLNDRVKFLGLRNDVPQLLQTSDLIILSSEYEGLSLANIEGMCVDKPFIASNAPGLREIVHSYGVLFEVGNVTELSDKINKLLTDKELYENVSSSCKKRSEQFKIEQMVEKYLTLYYAS